MQIICIDQAKYSTGIFIKTTEKEISQTIKMKSKIYQPEAIFSIYEEIHSLMIKHFTKKIKILAFIEGYGNNPRNQRSVRVNAEITGAIKMLLYCWNADIIIMPIQTWKSLTIGKIDKKDKDSYLNIIKNRYGKEFKNTDEADAYLFWQAAIALGRKKKNITSSQKKLKDMLQLFFEENKTEVNNV